MMGELISGATFVIVLAVWGGLPVAAQTHQFEQRIEELNCTLTETHNGSGTFANLECPPQAPTIDSIHYNNGRPVIRGKFDAANNVVLRVQFLGVWYVLGVDTELTAAGNMWTLDLSGLSPPLDFGSYEVIVEMSTSGGTTLIGSREFVIVQPDPDDHEAGTTDPRPSAPIPGTPNTGFMRVGVPLGASIVVAIIIGMLVLRFRRSDRA